jgi:hypothetical protein
MTEKQQKPVSRRASGTHRQVTGFIPEDLVKKMRIKAAILDLNQSEAIEAALEDWVEQNGESLPS